MTTAYTAISNTIESDRLAAYDDRDGLYRGETSFLDWREQTYPDWMKDTRRSYRNVENPVDQYQSLENPRRCGENGCRTEQNFETPPKYAGVGR